MVFLRRQGLGTLFIVFSFVASYPALGQGLFIPGVPSNVTEADFGGITPTLIRMMGVAAAHRPYEPATPLGLEAGVDLSLEVTLVRISDDTARILAQGGYASAGGLGVLPVAKLHFHKGLSERIDAGASVLVYQSYRIIGGDAKVLLYRPEEGPAWAMRLCYSSAEISFLSSKTISPQLLLSKEMTYADPYIGIGYEHVWGEVHFEYTISNIPGITPGTYRYDFNGVGGSQFIAFLGVGLKVGKKGLRLTVEGSYSTAGMHSLGTKVGFTF